MIYHLVKEKGFTLEGAKKKLKTAPEKTVLTHEIISSLESVKAELIKIKNEL
jgi:hypothetical protein